MIKRAVILAGGLGSRLKPFTEIIPKPLLPIGEKAVLEIQIEHLCAFGFKEIFLATNYKSEYIEKFLGDGSRYGVKLEICREKVPLGTAGPIKPLSGKLSDPFVVVNGDILSLLNYQKFFEFGLSKDTMLTVAIKKVVTPYAFGNIFFKNDLVTEIEEKPDIVNYVLAGIYLMKPQILNLIPDNEYFGMNTLIKDMLSKGLPIAKYEIEEYWLDVGQIDDYYKAQDIYEKHFKK
jgi:NDP-sugar pyrophosphorylase family protein